MGSIIQLWAQNREIFEKKSLEQIIQFAGEGKLRDSNAASLEFREFINNVSSEMLMNYYESCLNNKFEDSGFALQDLVNEAGVRLGFEVQFGLYHGRKNEIGFDGVWTSFDGHNFIVEVKTTDAYRINLEKLVAYKDKLTAAGKISSNGSSSILIIVGREDTGDLEAQIRGSKFAWDIRLMSTQSLLTLLKAKENTNDIKTSSQISEILKPKEYTRIDRLIDIMFVNPDGIKASEKSLKEISTVKRSCKKTKDEVIKIDNTHLTVKANSVEKKENKLTITQNQVKEIELSSQNQSALLFMKEEKTVTIIKSVSKIESHNDMPEPAGDEMKEKFWQRFFRATQSFSCSLRNLI
ncbi:MAG: hypothetical protein JSS63_15130 [Bacteroidetes bacterium]|nr:hypothetical protein [Bacteroidota bacterium]